MRGYRFRGKAIETSLGWIYGDLIQMGETIPFILHLKSTELVNGEEIPKFSEDRVNPETIGQFTELIDKDGNPVYEGDIVDCDYSVYGPWDDGKETLEPMRCVVEYDEFGFIFKKEEDLHYFLTDIKNIKVIGNVHDNPEMLKGGQS
jgi:uncharacterized phage protein (TIGR01671 family)